MQSTIMIPISEEEEANIDRIGKQVLHFHRKDRTFSVQKSDIYCYGEVDFKDKETYDEIDKFPFLNHLVMSGAVVYANYDYDSHSCSCHKKNKLWTETWSPAKLAMITHGYLGKPKRILLFNQTTKC